MAEKSRAQREAEHFDRLAEDYGEAWWGGHTPAARYRYQERIDWVVVEMQDVPTVELLTRIGGKRIVQMPYGRELPRIC